MLAAAGGWVSTAGDYFRFAAWRGAALAHFGGMPGVFSYVLRDDAGRTVVTLFNGRPGDDHEAAAALHRDLSDVLAAMPVNG